MIQLGRRRSIPAALAVSVVFTVAAFGNTGTVKEITKSGRVKIVWEGETTAPEIGRLGVVVDGDHNLALFRVISSDHTTSTVEILDAIWRSLAMEGLKARSLDDVSAPPPPEKSSLFVWSPHSGAPVRMDGNPAGKTPAELFLTPGFHQILVELPAGGRAVAQVEARAGEVTFLLLGEKIPEAKNGMGPAYFLDRGHRWFRRSPAPEGPLRWLEDQNGNRIYLGGEPLATPMIKKRVQPRYPELARRIGEEGTVSLYVLLGADGLPLHVQVISSPSNQLSLAAFDAVRKWTFQPATLFGKPVPYLYTVFVEFYIQR